MRRSWQRRLHSCLTCEATQGSVLTGALCLVNVLLCCYEILNNLIPRDPHFHFTLVCTNYVVTLGPWSGSLDFHYRAYWVLLLPLAILCCRSAPTLRASLLSWRWTLMGNQRNRGKFSLLGCWGNDFRHSVSKWLLQQLPVTANRCVFCCS